MEFLWKYIVARSFSDFPIWNGRSRLWRNPWNGYGRAFAGWIL